MRALILAAILALPAVAKADCDMPPSIQGTLAERLSRANEDMSKGLYTDAWRVAKSVTGMNESDPKALAQAHTIMAWQYWRAGKKDEARKELAIAKSLDANAVEAELDLASDKHVTEQIRADRDNG